MPGSSLISKREIVWWINGGLVQQTDWKLEGGEELFLSMLTYKNKSYLDGFYPQMLENPVQNKHKHLQTLILPERILCSASTTL